MPRQTEPNANNALGSLLQDMMPRGQVRSENTQAISGKPGLRPDIIIKTVHSLLRYLEDIGFSPRRNRPLPPGQGVAQRKRLFQSGIGSVYSH